MRKESQMVNRERGKESFVICQLSGRRRKFKWTWTSTTAASEEDDGVDGY